MQPGARLLYIDGAAGIAGDMCLGALVDLGVPVEHLSKGLEGLKLSGWTLSANEVTKAGLRATRVHVALEGDDDAHVHGGGHGSPHHEPHAHESGHASHSHAHQVHAPEPRDHEAHAHRTWPQIAALLARAELPERVRARALAVFRNLCEAEARIHGIALADVHLHEVGAVDALVDIVGTCLGLEWLGVESIACAPPDLGGGTVRCRHGLLPVPAPATQELLLGKPTRTSGAEVELTTPTGAALLATLSTHWGTAPPMIAERVGWGAGARDLPDRANVVRFVLGRPLEAEAPSGAERHVVIEADLDDADPQLLASFAASAAARGALDVVQQSVHMKKGRAGTRLTLLCTEAARPGLVDALFAETTTIGCRWHVVERAECAREIVTVTTPHGAVRVKVASWGGRVVNVKPEHDDVEAAARRANVPLKTVLAAAAAEALRLTKTP